MGVVSLAKTQMVTYLNPLGLFTFKIEEDKYKLIQVNKIETWFLDVKFNPKYKYCRDRLETEFNEIFTKLFLN